MAAVIRSLFFTRALRAATRLVGRGGPIGRLLVAAAIMLRQPRSGIAGIRDEAAAALRMVREFASGRYRNVPQRTLIGVVAGLIYFVNPLDLIPDLLPVIGLVDDAVVLTWMIRQVRRDLDAFLAWEREWGAAIDVDGQAIAPPELPAG